MIDLFFACNDCKTYIDSGGRWAYWELEEPKVVVRNERIDIQAVLAADQYWNPPQDNMSRWLYEEVFPPLQTFLRDHSGHNVVFVDNDYFPPIDDAHYFDWMQVGYANSLTPRYLVEALGIRNWEQVRDYIESLNRPPTWWEITWSDPSLRELARRKFEELTK